MDRTGWGRLGLPLALIGLLVGSSGCSPDPAPSPFTLEDMHALDLGVQGGLWSEWDLAPERAKDMFDHTSAGTYLQTLDPEACREWLFAGGLVPTGDAHSGDPIDYLGGISFESSTGELEPLYYSLVVRVLATESDAIAFLGAVEDAALACVGGYTYEGTATWDDADVAVVLLGTEEISVVTGSDAEGSSWVIVVEEGVSHRGDASVERVEQRILHYWQHGNVVVKVSTGDVVLDGAVTPTEADREAILDQIASQLDKMVRTRVQESS